MSNSENILYQQNANAQLYPASLTKLMTIYIAFEAISNRQISFNTPLRISKKAAAMPRSKLGLKRGSTITMEEAIMSLIIRSANDSAVVVAESLAGTEKKFAQLMNERAKHLGTTKTHFMNASGWHDQSQQTTATDMAKLALALKRDFPQYYHLFSRDTFFVNAPYIRDIIM